MLSFIVKSVLGELLSRRVITLDRSVWWTTSEQSCTRFMIPGTIIDVDSANRLPKNACFWRERSSTIQWDTSRVTFVPYKQTDRSCQIQNCCRFVGNLRALNNTNAGIQKCLAFDWNSSPAIEETESLAHRMTAHKNRGIEKEFDSIPYKSLLRITTTSNKSLL